MERAIEDQDYSKKEAAEVAGCDERTIHRAIKSQQLGSRKVALPGGGEKVLIKGKDLNEWMDSRDESKKPKHSAALTRQADTRSSDTPSAVTPEMFSSLVAQLAQGQQQIAALMERMTTNLLPAHADTGSSDNKARRRLGTMTDRLTVTLDEAARLSGIPNAKAEIKEAIRKKKLKAIKRPHGKFYTYRIMVDDLRDWLKTLRG